MRETLASIHSVGNAIEAGVWWSLAAVVLFAGCRSHRYRLHGMLTAVALLGFGLSDLVEIQTGAWWRPWWLLVWKAICIAARASIWWHYRRREQGHHHLSSGASPSS